MVNAQKRIQHRVQKEASNKETAELKKQVKQLKVQVSRLKKEVQKEQLLIPESIDEDEYLDEDLPSSKNVIVCQKCGSDKVGSYTTPNKSTIWGCKSCKHTWR